jgi:pentatricopeptide repeat protein
MDNLAEVLCHQGKYEEAEQIYLQMRELKGKTL